MPNKFGLSLRRNLLRLLLPPIVLALSLGAAVAYYVSIDVATEAHDQALADVALAISQRLRSQDGNTVLDLPVVAEQVLRIDEYDTVHFAVLDSKGELLGGEAELVGPPQAPKSNAAPVSRRVVFYDALFRQKAVRAVKLDVPCDGQICEVRVAETTVKRVRLARETRIVAAPSWLRTLHKRALAAQQLDDKRMMVDGLYELQFSDQE